VLPFGLSKQRLGQAIRQTGGAVSIVDALDDADTVMTLRSYYRRKPQLLRDAEARGIPVYVLKANTIMQMEQSILAMRESARRGADPVSLAMRETEDAIGEVMGNGRESVELTPQNAYIRRLQHQMAQRYNLSSRSFGREPHRRVRIYRDLDRREVAFE